MLRSAAADGARIAASDSSANRPGVVALWNDVRADALADYYEWHNREHMHERVGIPGFRLGRRFVAIDAQPRFLTLYDTDGAQVLTGEEYLRRLDNPTPWTRRAIAAFLNTTRSLCTVAFSVGGGEGGLIMTVRYEVAPSREAEMTAALVDHALPALADRMGVVRTRLCVTDRAASSVQTAEKKNVELARVPGWIILVEGGAEAAALESACSELLSEDRLTSAGALLPIERGLYQLQYAVGHAGERAAP
jgi:hypothetical protein